MVLNCRHVWDRISEYIDGSLSPEVRADVEHHLETCEICSAVLDSTRNVIILMADDRVFELPVDFSRRLHARLALAIAEEAPEQPADG
ncbi:anti-sigma factor family protein [Paracidobacterium acidisoli]|uniref:Zf-HC2 domain-containing protein n=1 Tax=Paracidobacterium acidisoli TaxID=2303751 RepID=A0A372IVP3_9BACT|nr:zf-HC2 domain-containing protein [Paracidobacterium acidisoli]MBT9329914.1 zf-HC2 domain-containing protein [Paracidobacterium acidisoli]